MALLLPSWAFLLFAPVLHVLLLLFLLQLVLLPYHSVALGKAPCPQGGILDEAGTNPPKRCHLVIIPAIGPIPPRQRWVVVWFFDNPGSSLEL